MKVRSSTKYHYQPKYPVVESCGNEIKSKLLCNFVKIVEANKCCSIAYQELLNGLTDSDHMV